MNWKSAIMWGAILWVLIFAAFSVIMFAPQLKDNLKMQTALELIVLPVLVIFAAYMFFSTESQKSLERKRQDFKGEKSKPAAKDGAVLGIYFLIVGTILDLLITIPLFVIPSGMTYGSFYGKWNMWLGFLETVVFGALTGYYLGKKK